MAFNWLKLLVADLSPRRSKFRTRPARVRFVVEKEPLVQDFLLSVSFHQCFTLSSFYWYSSCVKEKLTQPGNLQTLQRFFQISGSTGQKRNSALLSLQKDLGLVCWRLLGIAPQTLTAFQQIGPSEVRNMFKAISANLILWNTLNFYDEPHDKPVTIVTNPGSTTEFRFPVLDRFFPSWSWLWGPFDFLW